MTAWESIMGNGHPLKTNVNLGFASINFIFKHLSAKLLHKLYKEITFDKIREIWGCMLEALVKNHLFIPLFGGGGCWRNLKGKLVANEICWNHLVWGKDWCIKRGRGMQAKGNDYTILVKSTRGYYIKWTSET